MITNLFAKAGPTKISKIMFPLRKTTLSEPVYFKLMTNT